jgi:hypothetical protein
MAHSSATTRRCTFACSLALLAALASSAGCGELPTQPSKCIYSLSPRTLSLSQLGGSATVSLSTKPGCFWTAQAEANWILLTDGVQGAGSTTIGMNVASNTHSSARSGIVEIAGLRLTVFQQAAQ